jgi:hypothetical protein
MTLQPAYGRDYKHGAQVRADWDAGKDFIIADVFDPYSGKPINKEQVKPGQVVTIRFGGNRKVLVIKNSLPGVKKVECQACKDTRWGTRCQKHS